ncbi:MAG: hypothetical protein K2X27_15040 [Candidatus Obscuribacterales bacterium]|nr:hypothetical protein [Candidatus Obscuribacterales bacterium]
MPDVISDFKAAAQANDTAKPLQEDLWKGDALAHLKEMAPRSQNQLTELTVSRVSDNASSKASLPLPIDLDKNLKDLQNNLEKTQKQIAELRQNCSPDLFQREQSRLSFTGNPYKLLTAGTGVGMLYRSPGFAAAPLVGFAGLQGYDDFKSLSNSSTLHDRTKYTLGLAADASIAAGSIGFLMESVPMRYKAPLLIGGLLTRAAVDFIPNSKK